MKKKYAKKKTYFFLPIIAFILLMAIVFSLIKLNFSTNKIISSTKPFTDFPDYPLGNYYFENGGKLYKIDEKNNILYQLTNKDYYYHLDLSYDKKRFYVLINNDIYNIDSMGRKINQLTFTNGGVSYFDLSHDNKKILYHTTVSEENDNYFGSYILYLDNQKLERLPDYIGEYKLWYGMWDKNDNIISGADGIPSRLWNRKDNSFELYVDPYKVDKNSFAGPSPNKKYISANGYVDLYLRIYNNKKEKIYEDDFLNKRLFSDIGWTPDDKFFSYKIYKCCTDEKKEIPETIAIVNLADKEKKTFFPTDIPLPNKEIEIYPLTSVTSGRIYFFIVSTEYAKAKKNNFDPQLWFLDLKSGVFEKVKSENVKISDLNNNSIGAGAFWTNADK